MPQPLDQAYLWSINPQTGMDPSGNLALGSLMPTSTLNPSPKPTPINPYGNLPTPQFSQNARDSFGFVEPTVEQGIRSGVTGGSGIPFAYANPGETSVSTPYFDPNFPYESMGALRNYLAPKVQEGALAGLNARGLTSTGVGDYAKQQAMDYLNTIVPQESTNNLLAMDLNRLYGPNITNSLIKGSYHNNGSGGVAYGIPSAFDPGHATPIGDGSTSAQAAFIENPNYAALPSGPPQDGQQPTYPTPPGHGYHLLGNAAPASSSPLSQLQPYQQNYQPQYGLFDFASDQSYLTPGYWYNGGQMPDASRMPWLAGQGQGRISPNV